MSVSWPKAAELTYAEIEPGRVFEVERSFSHHDAMQFAALSGDFSPLHVDKDYAAGTEFGSCVVHGMLLASLFSQLVGMRIPGKHALYLGQDLTFRRPVRVGETVRATAKVVSKSEATRSIVLAMEIRDTESRVAVAGSAKVKLRDNVGLGAVDEETTLKVTAGTASRRGVAIVTGGSGGIGAEIVRTLAARGYAVAASYYRNSDRAKALVAEIKHAGHAAIAVKADVRDQRDVAAAVETVTTELGPPTLLVNAAIGELQQKSFVDLVWADFQRYLEYQVKAVAEFCQAVYPCMKIARGGAIVNVLSQVTSGQPPPRMADYVTAKYALTGLSRALAAEWADDRIRVNMVSPGLIPTDLTQHYQERVFKMEAARTPLKRLATSRDVAQAVAYLSSEEASFLTGVNLFVTGGQVMA